MRLGSGAYSLAAVAPPCDGSQWSARRMVQQMADHSGGPGADPASSPFGDGDCTTTFPGKLDILERVDLGEGIKRGSTSVDDSRTNHALRWVLVPRHVGPSILLLGQLKVANSAVRVGPEIRCKHCELVAHVSRTCTTNQRPFETTRSTAPPSERMRQ